MVLSAELFLKEDHLAIFLMIKRKNTKNFNKLILFEIIISITNYEFISFYIFLMFLTNLYKINTIIFIKK